MIPKFENSAKYGTIISKKCVLFNSINGANIVHFLRKIALSSNNQHTKRKYKQKNLFAEMQLAFEQKNVTLRRFLKDSSIQKPKTGGINASILLQFG